MIEILTLLQSANKKVGLTGPLLIGLAICIITYSEMFSEVSEIGEYISIFKTLSALLFLAGITSITFQLVSGAFRTRPAKGMIDGLAAGLFAGLFGGALGYGWHEVSSIPGFYDIPMGSSLERIKLCLIFSVPVGGIIGITLDFVDPEMKFDLRKNIGALILGFSVMAIALGFFVGYYAPIVKDGGVKLSDLQIISEIYILIFIIIVSFGSKLSLREFSLRIAILAILIIFWRISFSLIQIPHPFSPFYANEGLQDVSLSEMRAVFVETDRTSRLTEVNQSGMMSVVIMTSLCVAWIVTSFAICSKVSKILMQQLRRDL
ncbi:hypothetical protein [Pseudorhodobacter aquimaris]|uniref:hypothetical protein n=1 Tax=Pseudorhodobacter aquimaris TaxID=687412 RepID=UPI00067DE600|nr:hypothetical protein [Pseudorhodobacter aquimaris]